jgi:hypothetical protein
MNVIIYLEATIPRGKLNEKTVARRATTSTALFSVSKQIARQFIGAKQTR